MVLFFPVKCVIKLLIRRIVVTLVVLQYFDTSLNNNQDVFLMVVFVIFSLAACQALNKTQKLLFSVQMYTNLLLL